MTHRSSYPPCAWPPRTSRSTVRSSPLESVVTIAATSRDPRQFERPDELDVTRVTNPHLPFGYGIHYCVGAPPARLEGQVGIATLLELLPDIELGCRLEELRWRPTRIMRGVIELPGGFSPRH